MSIKAQLEAMTNSLNELKETLDSSGDVSELGDKVESLESDLSDVTSRLEDVENNYQELEDKLNDQIEPDTFYEVQETVGQLEGLPSDVETLQGTVTELRADNEALHTLVNALETRLAVLEGKLINQTP